MELWIVSGLLMSLVLQNEAYNILMLAPVGSWSEYRTLKILGETLTEVGHQVTLVAGYKPSKNSSVEEIFIGSPSANNDNIFDLNIVKVFFHVYDCQKEMLHKMYTNKEVLKIWKNRNNFDAIIGYSIINEIITPFLMGFHGTYIGLSSCGIEEIQIHSQGNRIPKSVIPFLLVNFDENMNFYERVMNIVVDQLLMPIHNYGTLPKLQALLENYFPGMPSIEDLYGNYSLLLINSHFSMDGMYPLLPNQVEIGTLAYKIPQPLPEDLKGFIEGAKHGVIYFSLGSLAKSSDIPKAQKAMLMEAFGQLTQRVVWKYEGNHIDNLTSNVITRKWLPQQDILGHPATLVFISHCGNHGAQEAKYHGVPVLGVPISFDQHRNAARLARKGYGRVLNWDEMTVDSIIDNINMLIKDTSYRESIQLVSAALQDQKESAVERAVWWIEYAIRHKNAPHLQYAGKNLNVIQYHLMDVWAFLISVLMLWISLTYLGLRRCCRKLLESKSKQD